MIPTSYTVVTLNELLRTSDVIWGTVTPNVTVSLVISEFVPSAELIAGDLIFADFDGSDPILVPMGDQVFITDSVSGRIGIKMKEPVGGYSWVVTGVTNLPQTVWGWAVRDADSGVLLWSELLPTPIPLTVVGNLVEVTAVLGYLVINPYNNNLEE